MATMKIEQRVEALARERVTSATIVSNADVTYLAMLVDAMQSQLGKRSRGKVNSLQQAQVLAEVDKRFYAAVLRGVTTEDIAIGEGLDADEQRRRSLERNRRSAFARSAKSTVSAYITAGGDVRTLDPNTVSKAALRKAIAPPEPTDKVAAQIERSKGALLRAITRRARGDPEAARTEVEGLMDELQKVLDSLNGGEAEEPQHETTTVVGMRAPDRGPQRTRVGVPLLNRGA
jgi:hypothetical protein